MPNPLSKYADLDEVQLRGMIQYAQRQYSYLDSSSPEALYNLCALMIDSYFMFDKKPTPIRSSYEFLREVTQKTLQNTQTGAPMFAERDFVFAIKMFGLKVRQKNGVNRFIPENVEADDDVAEETDVQIESSKDAKSLEFYVSDVHKRTKIQTHAIESATNRLLREWREIKLAKLFTDVMQRENKSIGQAREFLRLEYDVKDHEFVRIRKHAIDLGIFQSKRNPARINRRVTLDEDVVPFVEELTNTLAKKKNPLTSSQAVNQALRDLHKLITGKPLPKVDVKKEKGKARAEA